MKTKFLVLFFFFPFLGFAQEDKIIFLKPDTDISKVFQLNQAEWLFRFGDNPTWKFPELDDSKWNRTQKTTWFLDNTDFSKNWNGFFWLRLKFKADSSLRDFTHNLFITQNGAAEVYLDGILLQKFGKIGINENQEQTYISKNESIDLPFDDSEIHTLAIRYSNHTATKLYENYGKRFKKIILDIGIRFFNEQTVEDGYFQNWSFQGLQAKVLILGIYTSLCLLHFLLYFFFIKDKANLWYGIFTALLALYNLFYIVKITEKTNSSYLIFLELIGILLIMLYLISYLMFLYSVFHPKMIRLGKWFYLGSFIVFGLYSWLFFSFENDFYGYIILILFIVLVVLESLRVIISALNHKVSGIWLIGSGVILLTTTFIIGFVFVQLIPLIEIGSPFYIINEWISVFCMPITMFLFLAKRNSESNQYLENQLLEIQKLSSEKQKILESQKVDLEIKVEERTALYKDANEKLTASEKNLLIQTQILQEKAEELSASEEELRQQNDIVIDQRDTLEQKNQELEALTEELKQQTEILEEQKENLESLQSTKDLMISAVNHDLRNPLNPILNYSQVDYPKYSEKERLALVHERAKMMLSLINDIMDVYRADKLTIHPAPANLHQAVEEAIRVVSESKTTLPKIINEVPPQTMAIFEYKYIERVLENLLSNAVKYTKNNEKGGLVRLFASQSLSPPVPKEGVIIPPLGVRGLRISIADNGAGIPKDQLENIFLPFVNPNARNIGSAKSVGIGLTFCKTIVEAHGSKIEVESEEGVGTTFWFELHTPQTVAAEQKIVDDEENIFAIHWNEEEKNLLQELVGQIRQQKFHSANMRRTLQKLEVGESENFQTWKSALQQAKERGDEGMFEQLLSMGLM